MLASETTKKPSLVWQGSTLDNYTLRLTQVGLKRIIFQLPQQPGLKDFVKRNYQGNLQQAVARSVAQLARDALYAGSISQPNLSRKLHVFETQNAAGRNYQILALPVSGTESSIIAVRLGSQVDTAEYMAAKKAKSSAQGTGTKKAPLVGIKKAAISKHQRSSGSSGGNKSRRTTALGSTPGKKSLMGAKVLQRWHQRQLQDSNPKYNKTLWKGPGSEPGKNAPLSHYRNPDNWKVAVRQNSQGPRVFVDLDRNVHMGHKFPAVGYWEKGAKGHVNKLGQAKPKYQKRYQPYTIPGHQAAPKFRSPIHRQFMKDPANYRFEWGPANSSDGAKMKNAGNTYINTPPGLSWEFM